MLAQREAHASAAVACRCRVNTSARDLCVRAVFGTSAIWARGASVVYYGNLRVLWMLGDVHLRTFPLACLRCIISAVQHMATFVHQMRAKFGVHKFVMPLSCSFAGRRWRSLAARWRVAVVCRRGGIGCTPAI